MHKTRHLRALQIFNTAATHQKLSVAADSLSITQGAVSRQIKQLEDYLNVSLFHRTARGVVMTKKGEELHQITDSAFTTLEEGLKRFTERKDRTSIKVSLTSGLATKWLVPRLKDFRDQHPNIKIFLDTSDELVDFASNDIDVALRFEPPQYDHLFRKQVTQESLILVASPSLAKDLSSPITKQDILSVPILADDFDNRWADWCKKSDLKNLNNLINPSIHFRDSTVMISAAINGQGIALVRKLLVFDDLNSGHLVRLDDIEVPLERTLNFVCNKRDIKISAIEKFYEWIQMRD